MESFYNREMWFKKNQYALEKMYYNLLKISKDYGIILKDNNDTIYNFIYMIYNESNKSVINENLYPEYFNKKYNSTGYEKYKILN